jgi:hypothetical protein
MVWTSNPLLFATGDLIGRPHDHSGRIPKIGLCKIDHLIERMRVRRVPAPASGVCAVAALSSGRKSHPVNAPAGSNRLLFQACPLHSSPHARRLQNRARDGWRLAMRPRRETTRSPPRHAPPTGKPDGRSIIGMSNFVQTLDAGEYKSGLNREVLSLPKQPRSSQGGRVRTHSRGYLGNFQPDFLSIASGASRRIVEFCYAQTAPLWYHRGR